MTKSQGRCALVVALSVVAAGTMGLVVRPDQRELRATRFILETPEGREVAEFAATPSGSAGLTFRDENGKPRFTLAVVTTGPDAGATLTLQDKNGKQRATWTMRDDWLTAAIKDENDTFRTWFGMGTGGLSMRLHNENGKQRMTLDAGIEGTREQLYDNAERHSGPARTFQPPRPPNQRR